MREGVREGGWVDTWTPIDHPRTVAACSNVSIAWSTNPMVSNTCGRERTTCPHVQAHMVRAIASRLPPTNLTKRQVYVDRLCIRELAP